MRNRPFDVNYKETKDTQWVCYHCLNQLSFMSHLDGAIRDLLVDGGIGGDADWTIQKWAEYCLEDFGVEKFEGYGFFVGPEEHGKPNITGYLVCIKTEKELKSLICKVIEWHLTLRPEDSKKFELLAKELELYE